MKESHAFDQLRKPLRKLPDDSPMLISDEKWDKMLRDHDEALSKPLTSRQKFLSFLWGLAITVIMVGFAFIMTMPELRTFIGHMVEYLFQVNK
ncbi:MAG: hypothetical protein GC179_18475 [Anaerolineaceae bacterium]|nr:hypothetical protein [Anaerolineaceae bacterium]